MKKRVILITGTPCIGKTTLAKQLAAKLNALYINLTELAKTHSLTIGEDKTRKTTIIDQEKLRDKITETLNNSDKKTIIVDSHYAAALVPKRFNPYIFVLRRNPIELRQFMEKRGFSDTKMYENLASEILDVCLVEALQEHEEERVCELDITGKTAENVMKEVLAVLDDGTKCGVGNVDWLGMLEKQDLIDQYLKV
jgi:adenylate kinase